MDQPPWVPNLGKGYQYKEIGPENTFLLIAILFTIIFLDIVFIRKESNQMETKQIFRISKPSKSNIVNHLEVFRFLFEACMWFLCRCKTLRIFKRRLAEDNNYWILYLQTTIILAHFFIVFSHWNIWTVLETLSFFDLFSSEKIWLVLSVNALSPLYITCSWTKKTL